MGAFINYVSKKTSKGKRKIVMGHIYMTSTQMARRVQKMIILNDFQGKTTRRGRIIEL